MMENSYYSDIANKIKFAKWCLITFIVVFAFAGVILNSRELNADNLGYLMTYVNINGPEKTAKSEFYVELDENSSICYYKNNIAVLRKNRLDIYDVNGKRNFTSRLIYSNPTLKASGKYILSYDLGSDKMEIFNSFSRVFEYKGERPIYGAVVTDKGNVAYITSEKNYASAVYVMDSGFETKFRCLFENDYIVGADIDDKASRLAVAGFYVKDGDYSSRVLLYETTSATPIKTIEIAGEQPYGVKLCEDGVFALFENSLRCYSQNGDELSAYDFMYRNIAAAAMSNKFAAVALSEKTLGTDERLLIFDTSGNKIYDNVRGSEIIDIKFSEDCRFLYFLERTELYRVDIEKASSEFVAGKYDETANSIVHANAKNVFLSGLLKISAIDVK